MPVTPVFPSRALREDDMDPTEITVEVRRHPQDWQTATYRLVNVDALHWSSVSGGVARATAKPALFGYVLCNAMLSGEIAHSCQHGPPPHRVLVCLPKVANKELWSLLTKQVSSGNEVRPSGRLLAEAITPALVAKRDRAARSLA